MQPLSTMNSHSLEPRTVSLIKNCHEEEHGEILVHNCAGQVSCRTRSDLPGLHSLSSAHGHGRAYLH